MEIVIISSLVLAVLILHKPISLLFHNLYIKRQAKNFANRETFYHSIITNRIKFYNRLSLEDQHKFLFRTYLFHKSKRFHYIEVNETIDMPILVSAVAVQLTFGLEKFMFNYFDDIFIIRDDYHYGVYSRPFQGHVDQTGIYLSCSRPLLLWFGCHNTAAREQSSRARLLRPVRGRIVYRSNAAWFASESDLRRLHFPTGTRNRSSTSRRHQDQCREECDHRGDESETPLQERGSIPKRPRPVGIHLPSQDRLVHHVLRAQDQEM